MSLRNNSFLTNRFPNQQQQQPPSMAAQQFQTWACERDAFRREAESADKEREALEQNLRTLREQQKKVNELIHIASNDLGSVHRERDMLLSDRTRLKETLAKERLELEQCARDIELVCKDETEKKRTYCKTM